MAVAVKCLQRLRGGHVLFAAARASLTSRIRSRAASLFEPSVGEVPKSVRGPFFSNFCAGVRKLVSNQRQMKK